MNVLVLGGDGFIGSHTVDKLYKQGHNVTVFDRFPYNQSINLEHLRGKITFFQGEYANREQIALALKFQDVIYHFISATNPATSWDDPFLEIEVNLKNSVQLFEIAAQSGVKKIVFPSSGGAIYGRKSGVLDENKLPLPFSPYGITKLSIEYFLNYFKEKTGLSYDIYRIGNPYGPRQPMETPQGVIAVWMGKILVDEEISVYGDDETVRDYVYIDDVAYLLTHSMNNLESSDTYNLGVGKGLSVIELLEIFKGSIDRPFKSRVLARRSFDNSSVVLNSTKLISHFPGFKFQELKEKITDTWDYVKKHNKKTK